MDEVPEFPRFCEITLELEPHVRPALRALDPEIAEFTFGNLFVFRRVHAYRVSRLGPLLLILARGYDGRAYAFPPLGRGDVVDASLRLCEYLAGQGEAPCLFPVPEGLRTAHFEGPGWRARADRDQADYVYRREDLAFLRGRRYHKRRNRLVKFLKEEAGAWRYEALAPEHLSECLRLADGWCEIRCSAERPSTFQETDAVKDALVHRDALGLRGGVVLVEGRVRAFCLGEELNPETFVVHFEKTDPSQEGLAQLINREFCRESLSRYAYVNREQDLGDPGLRQAKEAYHPLFLAEKYRVAPA